MVIKKCKQPQIEDEVKEGREVKKLRDDEKGGYNVDVEDHRIRNSVFHVSPTVQRLR